MRVPRDTLAAMLAAPGAAGVGVRLPAVPPSAGCSEKVFQERLMELARAHGWLCYHTFDARRSDPGYPDLTLCHQRRRLLLFPELKTDVGRLTPDQRRWRDALLACGADWREWRPKAWKAIAAVLSGEEP